VTEERTKTVVLVAAKGMFNNSVDSAQTFGPCTARVVKYMAKSAAKNINSEESHTMVPTATRLGRLVLTIGLAKVLIWQIIPEIDGNASFRYEGAALLFGETDHQSRALIGSRPTLLAR
jgi:hypothetical protein